MLLEAIIRFSDDKPFDYTLLTGDLAYSGKDHEYERLVELLIEPLKRMAVSKDSTFIAVPGNHDIDCDRALPTPWNRLDERRQKNFFHLNDDARVLREPRSRGFSAFSKFLVANDLEGVDPTTEPATLLELDGVSFVSLVTSYFSDKAVADKELTPAPIHPIRYLLGKSNHVGNTVFVLGHHPWHWFTRDTRERFSELLNEKDALYLHGHEHRISTKFGPKGLLTLGFGAVYQSPADVPSQRQYSNSFAICEFDDSLHLKVISWNAEVGRWQLHSELPMGFDYPSDRIDGGYRFALPSTRQSEPFAQGARSLFQSKHRGSGCLWLAKDDKNAWQNVLGSLALLSGSDKLVRSVDQLPPGHSQYRVIRSDGTHIIRAISAHGDVLHTQTVQQLNVLFDTAEPASCIILTLGDISDEARTLLTKLSKRKDISFYDGTQIGDTLITHLSSSVSGDLAGFEKSAIDLKMMVLDDGIGVLVKDKVRGEWFRVYDHSGALLEEAEDLVAIIREAQPELQGLRYQGRSEKVGVPLEEHNGDAPVFVESDYLSRCYARFNDVRYAPLAALGFRFSTAKLTDIYVPAAANVGTESRSDESLERAIKEFLESLNINENEREQLEQQMRTSHGIRESAEISAARELYQRYGNVVVTGDPGSGKTCFVKREIVAYSQREGGGDGWYGHHLPVFVPLIEASQFLADYQDILEICSIVAARNAISVSKSTLAEYLSRGQLALFFDGLDEISSLDDRINILSRIREIIENYSKSGNRFVLTSRPAALQPVEVPKTLTHLRLSGLTESEVRVLAMRVITYRLFESAATTETAAAKELVDRLIEDCRGIAGIGRLARNPLLLTILVLVYANSGSLSGKRHVVYTQAIKTLVSVRNRPLKTKVLSETDLRERLGAVALAIYKHNISDIPTKAEILSVFAQYMSGDARQQERASKEFLREVAEETGLLVIHETGTDDDVISFMHHSFLEYYAAVGVLRDDAVDHVAELSALPQWREVITLLFGILSEQRDVTPYIKSVAKDRTSADRITKKRLLFAFDCALECDVPPEATQELLVQLVKDAVEGGAAKLSLPLRIDLGTRIGQLFQASGGEQIVQLIADGIEHHDAAIAAAYVDICAHMRDDVHFDPGIDAFERAFARRETVLRLACSSALRSRPEFRTDDALSHLEQCLKGNILERYTALRTTESVAGLAERLWKSIVDLLDDSNKIIAAHAARCIVTTGIFAKRGARHRRTLERALRIWQTTAEPPSRLSGLYDVKKEKLRRLLKSSHKETVLNGIHYLALLQRESVFVYEAIMTVLGDSVDHQVRTACLSVLQNMPDVLGLITLADTEFLCSLLESRERDVRIAAARVLGSLSPDEQVCNALERSARTARNRRDVEEFYELMEAVVQHAASEELVSDRLNSVISEMNIGFGDDSAQEIYRHSLRTLNEARVLLPFSTTRKLYQLSRNYKAPKPLRREALRVFGGLSEPSTQVLGNLSTALRTQDRGLRQAAYEASANFVANCKHEIRYVRSLYELMPEFRDVLCRRWEIESKAVKDRIDDKAIADIRKAIVEIEGILDSYAEYSGRVQANHKT